MPFSILFKTHIDSLIIFSNQTNNSDFLKEKAKIAAFDLSVLSELYFAKNIGEIKEHLLNTLSMQLSPSLNMLIQSLEKGASEPTFSKDQFYTLLIEAKLAVFQNLDSFFKLGKEAIPDTLWKTILSSVQDLATLDMSQSAVAIRQSKEHAMNEQFKKINSKSKISLDEIIVALTNFCSESNIDERGVSAVNAVANDLSIFKKLCCAKNKKEMDEIISEMNTLALPLGPNFNLSIQHFEKSAAEPVFSSASFRELLTEFKEAVMKDLCRLLKESGIAKVYHLIIPGAYLLKDINVSIHPGFFEDTSPDTLGNEEDIYEEIHSSFISLGFFNASSPRNILALMPLNEGIDGDPHYFGFD